MDIVELTDLERQLLARSSDLAVTRRRIKVVLLSAGLLVALLIWASLRELPATVFAGAFALYVIITALEGISYTSAVLGYKGLVQKLAQRIEELEAQA